MVMNFYHDDQLDGAREGIVESSHGKLLKETKITLDKWPGRELLVGPTEGTPLEFTYRIYCVGKRQYCLAAGGATGLKPSDADTKKFFDSFKPTAE